MLWFLRNVARNSPTCISNIEIASLEFCGFLDTYEKLGYPNYVRVLVDEAPKANSCVRSSSHDTVHDPRDSSPLGSARDHVQEPGGTTAIVDGRHVQDDSDVCVPVGGVSPHVFIHANDTHAVEPSWIIDHQTHPFSQDSSVGGSSMTCPGPGDARHRHMMNDHARQRPAHRHARELRARIGRLTHILTPHVSTRLAPVAAHAHMQNRGTLPVRLVRQAPDHRVTTNAPAPAASTPPVLTSKTARQHCMVRLNVLTRHLQPQAIQARERAQIRAIKGSAGHVEVFQMDGVGTPIIGRPRPLSGHDTPNPANNTYTLTCEEPVYCPDEPGVLTPRPHGARSAWRRAWPARAPRSSRRA